jgi:lipopolysaccharide export system permease protein
MSRLRPRLSPVMDRFIAGQFFGPFMVCLAAFTAAYLLGDMFDRFDDLIHYGGLGLLGLEYFALKLPLIVSQILPVASLAGVLLGFALLNRSGEVLACQQLGISRLEMAVPVLVVAVLISAFDFIVSETVVPAATREAKYIYSVQLKKRQLRAVFANRRIWVRVRDGFISVESYDKARGELAGVTHYQLDDQFGLKDLTHATGAKWDGHQWVPTALTSFQLAEGGAVTNTHTPRLELGLTPADFGLVRFDPEEFSVWELDRYIQDLRNMGLDPGGYVVDRDLKYAMPLACLIMVALGMALSLDPLPRNLSLGRSFGLAIVIGFGYWLSLGITSSLGRSGLLPGMVAAWLPNFMFSMIALSIFLFGEER